MSVLVAKRYVKALLDGRDLKDISKVEDELKIITTAYNDEKFLSIISSIEVDTKQKTDLILSFIDKSSQTIENLVRLLGDNRRLNIIPDISSELSSQVSILKNSYIGIVYSNVKLSKEDIKSMESGFSKKFNIKLILKNEVCSYNGIKVDIDGLGIEIGFSQERLRTQMIEHILKAV